MTVRELRPDDWAIIETLFGENGACGGCWCRWWQFPQGGKLWHASKGRKNRAALKAEVGACEAHAVIAFEGETPVGWCRFGPRESFPRIQSIKAIRGEAPEGTWSVVCFYIPAKWRRKGIARALLDAAVHLAFASGAKRIEGYPYIPKDNKPAPPVFAWAGVPRLFESAGFQPVSERTWLRTPA